MQWQVNWKHWVLYKHDRIAWSAYEFDGSDRLFYTNYLFIGPLQMRWYS